MARIAIAGQELKFGDVVISELFKFPNKSVWQKVDDHFALMIQNEHGMLQAGPEQFFSDDEVILSISPESFSISF